MENEKSFFDSALNIMTTIQALRKADKTDKAMSRRASLVISVQS
jgi:hypothetical protein